MKIGTAALAAILTATPSLAMASDNPFAANKTTLDLRGLDLTSVEWQQRLAIRMDHAARTVCGEGMDTIHLALGAQARACRADVLADIRTRIATATASADSATAVRLASR
ncbi:MAG: UrcA family protein [Sphingomonas bacterium]|nr:UrcA family protein [Sphingomonas bacterium]